MSFSRLSHDYVRGYTSALQDVLQTFENIAADLKLHKKKQNLKTMKDIVECMLKNRAIIRENPGAFVRCNNDGFEIYIENEGIYISNERMD